MSRQSDNENCFRKIDGSLDRDYLRTCAIYRLLKGGRIDKAGSLELARRRIRGSYGNPKRLDATIEIWLNGPLKAVAAGRAL